MIRFVEQVLLEVCHSFGRGDAAECEVVEIRAEEIVELNTPVRLLQRLEEERAFLVWDPVHPLVRVAADPDRTAQVQRASMVGYDLIGELPESLPDFGGVY